MMVMFHDDDCGELLDGDGECPTCKFHPDMQSTGFREVPDEAIADGIARLGRTYLGAHRERVNRVARADAPAPATPPALTLVPPPPTEEEQRVAELTALEEEIYAEFMTGLTALTSSLYDRYTGDFTRAATLISVLHAAHAEEVGRHEKILEEAHRRAGLAAPDLVEIRRERMARGRSRGRAE